MGDDHGQPTRRLCVLVDLENYSLLDGPTQHRAQQALDEALSVAADAAGLRRPCWDRQKGGDGEFAVLPVGEDEEAVAGEFPLALDRALRAIHRRDGLPLRVRLVVHQGKVVPAALGWSGPAAIESRRMVDCPPVKAALAGISSAYLVLAMSPNVYDQMVQPGYTAVRPEQFRQVRVDRIKRPVWIMIPGTAPGRIPVEEPPTADRDAAMKQQADWAGTAIQSGRDSVGNAIGHGASVNTTTFGAPVHTGDLHIGPRHG